MAGSMMPGLGDSSLMPFVPRCSGGVAGSGSAGPGDFVLVGGVYVATIVFATPAPSTDYAVAFGVIAINNSSFIPTVTNVLTTGFTIVLNTNNLTDFVSIGWLAVAY